MPMSRAHTSSLYQKSRCLGENRAPLDGVTVSKHYGKRGTSWGKRDTIRSRWKWDFDFLEKGPLGTLGAYEHYEGHVAIPVNDCGEGYS